jgi:hypothetical protein
MFHHFDSETKLTNTGKLIRLRICVMGLLKDCNFINTLAVANCQ